MDGFNNRSSTFKELMNWKKSTHSEAWGDKRINKQKKS